MVDRYAIRQPVTRTVDAEAGGIGGGPPVTASGLSRSNAGLCRGLAIASDDIEARGSSGGRHRLGLRRNRDGDDGSRSASAARASPGVHAGQPVPNLDERLGPVRTGRAHAVADNATGAADAIAKLCLAVPREGTANGAAIDQARWRVAYAG